MAMPRLKGALVFLLVLLVVMPAALLITPSGRALAAHVLSQRSLVPGAATARTGRKGNVTSSVGTCSPWRIIASPNPPSVSDELLAVSATGPHDVWAVGDEQPTANGSAPQTLIEHWNGAGWSVTSSPNATTDENILNGVAATSSSDAWAVGFDVDPNTFIDQALIERWNGTNWSIVSAATPTGAANTTLWGVAAVSASDVWAVGDLITSTNTVQTLTEHWNGSAWSVVASPNVNSTSLDELLSVTVVATNDVWAVGIAATTLSSPFQTLVEHWNGTSWSIVASPAISGDTMGLRGVAAISASDVWAVGIIATATSPFQTLTEHWNGSAWSTVASPNVGTNDTQLVSVAAVGTNSVWAVGQVSSLTSKGFQPLIEHWNGSAWSIVSAVMPTGAQGGARLDAVGVVPSTQTVWAVGTTENLNGTGVSPSLTELYTTPFLGILC